MMIKMKKNLKIFFGAIIITAIIIIYINDNHSQIDTLQNDNQQLERQNKQLHAEASYNVELLSDNTTDGYYRWSELEETAERFTDDSDGRFKKTWGLYLANESKRYDIDPYLIYELLKVETGGTFDPTLIGPETQYGHAYGMSQFMKNTAPWIADMAGLPYSKELLFDPYYSIQIAVVYLDFLYHKYDNWDEALTAYHRGMTGMEIYKQANGTARSDYAKQIQTRAEAHRLVVRAN